MKYISSALSRPPGAKIQFVPTCRFFYFIALNRVLGLPSDRARKVVVIPPKIMGFENKNVSVMKKH